MFRLIYFPFLLAGKNDSSSGNWSTRKETVILWVMPMLLAVEVLSLDNGLGVLNVCFENSPYIWRSFETSLFFN